MRNQTTQKVSNADNELGNKFNIFALISQKEPFSEVRRDASILLFKLGRTEEEILIEIVGKLLTPTNISSKNQVKI